MRCRVARQSIELEVDGGLKLETRFQLEAHLESCAKCHAYALGLRRIESALMAQPDGPLQSLDLDRSITAIRAGIETGAHAGSGKSNTKRRAWIAAASLVAAAAVVYFGVNWALDTKTAPLREQDDVARLDGSSHDSATPDREASAPGAALDQDPAEPQDGDSESRDSDSPQVGESAFVQGNTTSAGTPAPDLQPGASLAETSNPIQPPEAPLDPRRLAAARSEVRELLLAAGSELSMEDPDQEVDAFVELFDLSALSLRDRDWPVRRLVEHWLELEDPFVARLAARYLGQRGDSSSRTKLQRSLDRPQIARAATLALCDAGPQGAAGLGHALQIPSERQLAMNALLELDPHIAAEQLILVALNERDLERASAADPAEQLDTNFGDELLRATAELGPIGLEHLFELCEEQWLGVDELVDVAQSSPDAGTWAIEGVDEGTNSRSFELRLAIAVDLSPEAALPRLVELLDDRDWRQESLNELGQIPGDALAQVVLQLQSSEQLANRDLEQVARAALTTDSVRFTRLAFQLTSAGDEEATSAMAELLVALDTPYALGAMLELAQSPQLRGGLSRDLVLAIGRHGEVHDAEVISSILARLGEDDRHLAAACVIALHQLESETSVTDALRELDSRRTMNLLRLLRRHQPESRVNPLIYKISRELRPMLSKRETETWRSSL